MQIKKFKELISVRLLIERGLNVQTKKKLPQNLLSKRRWCNMSVSNKKLNR